MNPAVRKHHATDCLKDEHPMNSLELKIPPAIVFGLTAWGMWWLADMSPGLLAGLQIGRILTRFLFVLGALFGAAALFSFYRARTSIDPHTPKKASALVTSGVYRITRNPMYFGMALFLAGWAIRLDSLLSLLAGVIFFVAWITRFQILPEERVMSKKFGSEYEKYKSSVQMWI